MHVNEWAEKQKMVSILIDGKEDIACWFHLVVTHIHRAKTFHDKKRSMPNLESLMQCSRALK